MSCSPVPIIIFATSRGTRFIARSSICYEIHPPAICNSTALDRRRRQEAAFSVTNLPVAPEGKMYAVWTIAQKSAPHYVGKIKPDGKGQGGLHINSTRSALPMDTFAVTLENQGTTTAPAGPIVLVSKQS